MLYSIVSTFKRLSPYLALVALGYLLLIIYTTLVLYSSSLKKDMHLPLMEQKLADPVILNSQKVPLHKYSLFGNSQTSMAPITSWKVTGIITRENREHDIIIKYSDREKILAKGDKIDGRTQIKSIEKEKVILIYDGQEKYLPLFKFTQSN